MNLFELGWGSYEDFERNLFVHPTKTQVEFQEDCASMLKKYG